MKINRPLLYAGGLLLVLLAFFQIRSGVDTPSSLPMAVTTGKPTGAPFTLQGKEGPVSLSDFEDQLILIYFGYTWCPDICPSSMMFMARAIKNLSPEEQARIQPMLISVDPQRDTPERLASYVDFFEAGIIGLTGEEEYLRKLVREYGAFFRYTPVESAMEYTVDHTSEFYLVNHRGELVDTLSHNLSGNQLSSRLQQALQQL